MQEKIFHNKIEGFSVYEKTGSGKYLRIIRDFMRGAIPGCRPLNSGSPERQVYRLEVDGVKYVLKWERELDPRLEKRIWRFLAGPYYSRLIYRVAEARRRGCRKTSDIYCVAERVARREAKETYVLAEYVEGTPLAEVGDISAYRDEIKACVAELHRHRLASNDLHSGNIIITPQGLRVIDLSDYGNLSICQANDAFALQRFYGIELELNTLAYRFIGLRNRFRTWSRRVRGKGR